MREEATIFDDRETVELLAAQPQLLAIADAVRATQGKRARSWNVRPRLLLAAAAVAALGALGGWAFSGSVGHPRTAAVVVYPAHDLLYLPSPLTPTLAATQSNPSLAGDYRLAWFDAKAEAVHADATYAPMFGGGFSYADDYAALDRVDYAITRTGGAISSIAVTVLGRGIDGSVLVQVHRKHHGKSLVVFSRRRALRPVIGTAVPSEWLGTLSPSNWAGGCLDARYWLTVGLSHATRRQTWGTLLTDPGGFNCRRAGAR